jgi:5-methylcytosine-specific restriction enzyme subunit McrC
MSRPTRIELPEYQSISLPAAALPEAVGVQLFENYATQIATTPPTFKNSRQWQLTNQGWVGHIPLNEDFHFALTPKVPLQNIFGMLEYAYRLSSFQILDGTIACETLDDLYERLAHILAKRVLERGRKGYHREYISEHDYLPCVRGRLDLPRLAAKPWAVSLPCHFQEHTANIEDNQLLTWTLFRIARSGVCSERVLPTIRRTYRTLQSLTTLTPFTAQACVARLYHRLNDDYRPLHALARFFLEQSGPGHQLGDRMMVPFLVNMARLYELFVAEWLRLHLPHHLRLRTQHKVLLDETSGLRFEIDLLIEDAATGEVLFVLDTKYKAPTTPSTDDISQIIAYAQNQGAPEALLVYPSDLPQPLRTASRGIRIRSLTFALDGNLELAGAMLLETLLTCSSLACTPPPLLV